MWRFFCQCCWEIGTFHSDQKKQRILWLTMTIKQNYYRWVYCSSLFVGRAYSKDTESARIYDIHNNGNNISTLNITHKRKRSRHYDSSNNSTTFFRRERQTFVCMQFSILHFCIVFFVLFFSLVLRSLHIFNCASGRMSNNILKGTFANKKN